MHINGMFDGGPATPPQEPSLVQSIVSTVFQYKALQNQNDLMKINLQRAQQGLTPINYNQVPGIVPTIGIAPDAGTAQAGLIGGGLLLTLVGVGVLALILKK